MTFLWIPIFHIFNREYHFTYPSQEKRFRKKQESVVKTWTHLSIYFYVANVSVILYLDRRTFPWNFLDTANVKKHLKVKIYSIPKFNKTEAFPTMYTIIFLLRVCLQILTTFMYIITSIEVFITSPPLPLNHTE